MKFKKALATLMVASMATGAIPVSNVSATSEPRVYVNMTYENDGNIRADIMFENVPDVSSGGFHVEVGDSWNLKMDSRITDRPKTTTENCTSKEAGISPLVTQYNDNDLFICFAAGNQSGFDLNGRFFSFYVEKADDFTLDDAKIDVVFQQTSDNAYDFLATGPYKIIKPDNYNPSPMVGVYEYMVGDVDNDGYVNVIDASQILSALSDNNNQTLYVKQILSTYKSWFPSAICPAAPDVNQDNMISQLDAELIMNYYVNASTSDDADSKIGKLDFYETYDN